MKPPSVFTLFLHFELIDVPQIQILVLWTVSENVFFKTDWNEPRILHTVFMQ